MNDLRFGKAGPADRAAMTELWGECFPEDAAVFAPWYFAESFQPERSWLCRDGDGQLLAMLVAPDLRVGCRGRELTVPYVQGVATRPAARMRGLANRLLELMAAELTASGVPFALLKPFRVDFYARSGWTVLNRIWETVPERLPALPGAELLEPSAAEVLNEAEYLNAAAAVYQGWLRNCDFGFFVERDARHWRRLLTDHFRDGGRLSLLFADGEAAACALWLPEAAGILVRELFYTAEAAGRGLVGLLQEKAEAGTLRLCQPEQAPLLPETVAGGRLYPFAMARLLNVGAALELTGLKQQDDLCFKLGISQLTKLCLGCYNQFDDVEPAAAGRNIGPQKAYFDEYFV